MPSIQQLIVKLFTLLCHHMYKFCSLSGTKILILFHCVQKPVTKPHKEQLESDLLEDYTQGIQHNVEHIFASLLGSV